MDRRRRPQRNVAVYPEDGNPYRATRTAADGSFVLRAVAIGRQRIVAVRPEEAGSNLLPWAFPPSTRRKSVTVTADRESETRIVMKPARGWIKGQVVGLEGEPLPDIVVDAASMDADGITAMTFGAWRNPVLTDRDGNFEIVGLTECPCTVRAYRRGGGRGGRLGRRDALASGFGDR